ncbi:hypothetical protein GA0070608_5186 [Micromonospora peucetia]|uniref:Uncharacterized protein n=1 Tax=Micromonospora peucetia TaxID=47871 RepID=A0A1C6W2Q6_9ACTN|nr:hypothetical protein GA0070608_5186 [Micromonospora peucetia]
MRVDGTLGRWEVRSAYRTVGRATTDRVASGTKIAYPRAEPAWRAPQEWDVVGAGMTPAYALSGPVCSALP